MKCLGLVVLSSLALLATLFFAMADPSQNVFASEPVQNASVRLAGFTQAAPGLILTVTLDTEPACLEPASTPPQSTIEVQSDTTVYYCYTIKNNSDATVISHTIEESNVGSGVPLTVNARVEPGDEYHYEVEQEITQSTSSLATWKALGEDEAASLTATSQSTVTVVDPNLLVTLTVGNEQAVCADAKETTAPSGGTAYFCLTVVNTGDITLTQPTFFAPALNLGEGGVSLNEFILPPGDRQVLTSETLRAIGLSPFLELTDVTTEVTVEVTVEWATSEGAIASASDTARVDVDNAAIDVRKTLSVDPDLCTNNRILTVSPDQQVYYCLVIRNIGEVTLTEHTFIEPPSGVQGAFQYNLAPGTSLTLTQGNITDTPDIIFSQSPRLGPFQQTVTETRLLTFTSANAQGFQATTVASSTLNVSLAPLSVVLSGWSLPNVCALPPNPTQTFNIGGRIWYCVQIRNNSSVALTNHRATQIIRRPNGVEGQILYSVTREFTHTIQPGESRIITNSFFTSTLQQPPFLGPFTVTVPLLTTTKLTNTIFFTSTNPDVGFTITNRSSFSIFVNPVTSTPTPTFTVTPGPTDTPTPAPTFTPLGGIPTLTPTPTATAIALSLPPTPTPTTDFSVSSNVSTPDIQFISPVGPPTPTPAPTVESPLPTPSFTPDPAILAAEIAATETILAASFTPTATATETATATATETATATPTDTATATATQRPIEPPVPQSAPMITPDSILLFSQIVDASVAAAGWIWFAIGSLVFFTVAGIVAGLSFRQQERQRYQLHDDPQADDPSAVSTSQLKTSKQSSNSGLEDDDQWPASLP